MFKFVLPSLLAVVITGAMMNSLHAQVLSDLKTDWSNVNNPNGLWTYRHGTTALPAVTSWQSTLGGWSSPQPGWARSENGTDRLPFWFRSNGSETFNPDTLAGDIVVHNTDTVNGVGSGLANVIWTSNITGSIAVSGNTWITRDIGRANTWSIWKNAAQLTSGVVSSGDAFNRANPFNFSGGTGGGSVLDNISVVPGDIIMYQIVANNPTAGEFTGVNMTISIAAIPEPGTIVLISAASLISGIVCFRKWKRSRRRRTTIRTPWPAIQARQAG